MEKEEIQSWNFIVVVSWEQNYGGEQVVVLVWVILSCIGKKFLPFHESLHELAKTVLSTVGRAFVWDEGIQIKLSLTFIEVFIKSFTPQKPF